MSYELKSSHSNQDFGAAFSFGAKTVSHAKDLSLALDMVEVVPHIQNRAGSVFIFDGNSQGQSDVFYGHWPHRIRGFAYQVHSEGIARVLLSHNLFPNTVGANDQGYATLIELVKKPSTDVDSRYRLEGEWAGSIGFVAGDQFKPVRNKWSLCVGNEFFPYTMMGFSQVSEDKFGVQWKKLEAEIRKID